MPSLVQQNGIDITVYERDENPKARAFVFITSSAKAIPIKNEKTDATIPVFNVIQSGAKSIVPIIHLP